MRASAALLLAIATSACGAATHVETTTATECAAADLAPWGPLWERGGAFALPRGWRVEAADLPRTLTPTEDGAGLRLTEGELESPRRFTLRACSGACCASHLVELRPPLLADEAAAQAERQLVDDLQHEVAGIDTRVEVLPELFAEMRGLPPERFMSVLRAPGGEPRALTAELFEELVREYARTRRRRFFVLSSGELTLPSGFVPCGDPPDYEHDPRAPQKIPVRMATSAQACADAAFDAELVVLPSTMVTGWGALAPRGDVVDRQTIRLTFDAAVAPLRDHLSVTLPAVPDARGAWLDAGEACGVGGCVYELRHVGSLLPSGGAHVVVLRLLDASENEVVYDTTGVRVDAAARRVAVRPFGAPTIDYVLDDGDVEVTSPTRVNVTVEHPLLELIGSSDASLRLDGQSAGTAQAVSGHPARRRLRLDSRAATQAQQPGAELTFQIDAGLREPLVLRVRTNDCRYELHQLTALYAGMSEAVVLAWVFSDGGGCLDRALGVRAPASQGFELGQATWWSPSTYDAAQIPGAVLPRGTRGRVLAIEVRQLEDGAARLSPEITLVHPAGSGDPSPAVGPTGAPASRRLAIRPGLDRSAVVADIEVVPTAAQLPQGTWIPRADALVLERRNFIELPYPDGHAVRYDVYSRTAGIAPCADAVVWGDPSEAFDGPPPHALPGRELQDRTRGERLQYCVVPSAEAASFAVEIELRPRARDLLETSLGLPTDHEGDRLFAGRRRVTIDRPVRRLHQPWALPATTALVCDSRATTPELEAVVMMSGEPHEPMRRDEYRRCALRVALPYAGSCDPADVNQLFRRTGPQHLEILVARQDDAAEVRASVRLDEGALGSYPDLACHDRAIPALRWSDGAGAHAALSGAPDAAPGGYLFIPLPDLLQGIEDDIADFDRVRIEVRHAATPFDAIGATPYVAPSTRHNASPDAVARYDTRVRSLNGLTSAFYGYGHTDALGPRYSFDVMVGFSAIRTPSTGWEATTSSEFDRVEDLEFQYGVLLSLEPWNYSSGQQYLPVANPQLQMGLLLPTDFDRETIFHSISFVVGLGLRLLPTPRLTAGVDTTINATLWWEIAAGPRDTVSHALLVGFNGSIKTD